MSATAAVVVPLLIFEAATCLMAVPAAEIAQLEGSDPLFMENESRAFDLGEYFTGLYSDGPWLRWGRGAQSATLRVTRVVDVVPVALSSLTPMPTLLRGQHRTRAFFAAGISDDDVFLLLDPARLNSDSGFRDASRLPDASYRVSP